MSEKDITPFEVAFIKRQAQRISALGEGVLTITFKDHRLQTVGISAELRLDTNDYQGTLDNPRKMESELRD